MALDNQIPSKVMLICERYTRNLSRCSASTLSDAGLTLDKQTLGIYYESQV